MVPSVTPYDLAFPQMGFHVPQDTQMAISPQRLIRYTSCLVLGYRVLRVGGSNGAISGYIKSKTAAYPSWRQAAILDNFEWSYLRNGSFDPLTLCSEKNTHSHFLSYIHELFVDLNKNCSEYTQGLIDSENVKIRYSLRSMT